MIGKEYALVKQRAQSEHDCIEKVFLTYNLETVTDENQDGKES